MGSSGSELDGGAQHGAPAAEPTPVEPGSREKILDVAEALFSRRGFSGVGVREVAEGAGLSKSSLFHHFRTKMQLYEAVLERVLARIHACVQPALRSGGAPADRLDRSLDALIDALTEHPTTARLLLRGLFEDDDLQPPSSPEGAAAEATLLHIIHDLNELLAEGVGSGDFRPVSAAHTVQTLIGATVYHFASGEFGEGLIGGPLLSADAVRRRKEEVRAFMRQGLSRGRPQSRSGGTS